MGKSDQTSAAPIPSFLTAMAVHQATAAKIVVAQIVKMARVAQVATAILRREDCGRLIYIGAGTSGRLAVQDAAELYPTFGFDRVAWCLAGGAAALARPIEGAEDDTAAAAAAMAQLAPGRGDVVIAVTASGRTPYTLAALAAAKEQAGTTIAVVNSPASPACDLADHVLVLDTGPEVLAGSTRLTAGTAQKIALNMLSTQIMDNLGHIYQGQMVDVVPTNVKLVNRAIAMVAQLTEVDEDTATRAWQQAGRQVKTAILLLDGHTLDQARVLLAQHGGHLSLCRAKGYERLKERKH